ncbi:NAD(P)-dependent alcohol dehydrogenase [Demequina sp. NBRC 110056]|uniref:NAD(P)-dependent alcohol dehydrogenase n=1 Tax=Demequina sp. NBRC 110056 TaxID=1570345 RepID=UPI0009FE65F9|nr:NAD(P)-dependent alcohol dehydrogenase [Demequina sp. NBRC 110056]
MSTTPPAKPSPAASTADAAALPATTAAAVQREYGPPETITVATLPLPSPAPHEVVVRVAAAGVDRGVWHMATGRPFIMRAMGFGLRRPSQPIQGSDVAGTVVAVGTEVTRFEVGDVVMGSARGSFAEHAIADASRLTAVPEGVPLEVAAAAPVSGVTAQAAVMEIGQVEAGQRVLVLGASGGVGSSAVQLAVAAGAHVTGVCSSAKAHVATEAGAAVVLDYRTVDVTALDGRFDLIVDTGGLTPLRALRRILAPRGTLVIVGGEGGGGVTGGFGRQLKAAALSLVVRQRLAFVMSTTTERTLDELAGRIARGQLRPIVTATYPLERTAHAISDLAAGRVAGKAVVTLEDQR